MSEAAVAGDTASETAAGGEGGGTLSKPSGGSESANSSGGGSGGGATDDVAGSGGSDGLDGLAGLPEGVSQADLAYVANKGWKHPGELLNAYKQLEGLRGVPSERLLALPETSDDAEAMEPVWNKLGRPETKDGYDLEAIELDDSMTDLRPWFAEVAHARGLTQAQAKGLAEDFMGWQAKLVEGQSEAKSEKFESGLAELERDLRAKGVNPDHYQELARQGVRIAGFDVSDPAQKAEVDRLELEFGANAVRIFARIGQLASEAGQIDIADGGEAFAGAVGARAKLDQLHADPEFVKSVSDPQHPKHKENTERRDALYAQLPQEPLPS